MGNSITRSVMTREGLMSRTTFCLVTAGALTLLSLGFMAARRQVLGEEILAPTGPGTFKVTVRLHGKSQGNAKVQMLCPLDFKQQHVFREEFTSQELTQKTVEGHAHDRRQVLWIQKAAGARTAFECVTSFIAPSMSNPLRPQWPSWPGNCMRRRGPASTFTPRRLLIPTTGKSATWLPR